MHACVSECVCASAMARLWRQRAVSGVGPHLPPCSRQNFLMFDPVFTRLDGLKNSGDSPVSTFHLIIGRDGKCVALPGFWGYPSLGPHTCGWLVIYPVSISLALKIPFEPLLYSSATLNTSPPHTTRTPSSQTETLHP